MFFEELFSVAEARFKTHSRFQNTLRKAEPLLRHRHYANAFARRRENSVANGGQNWRQSRFAQARWWVVGLQEMDFDLWRRLRHF